MATARYQDLRSSSLSLPPRRYRSIILLGAYIILEILADFLGRHGYIPTWSCSIADNPGFRIVRCHVL